MDKKSDLSLTSTKGAYTLKKVSHKDELKKHVDTYDGFIIDTKGDEKEARKLVDSLKKTDKVILVQGFDNVFNRRVIETMKVHYLVDAEKEEKRDTLKQRDSGMNHVTAKLAKKNGVALVINLANLQKESKQKKAARLSRIMQNIDIAKKAGNVIKVASFNKGKDDVCSVVDRQNFLISLGASTKQAKEAVLF